MKLRTKVILFFGIFLAVIVAAVIFYAEYIVGDIFKKQTTDNFRIIAEQSESSYVSFLGSMRVRVLDWTSDNTIRELSKEILASPKDSSSRARLTKEFTTYITEKKMPYDKTIFLTDLLDSNGIVIASTQPKRIGNDEKDEEVNDKLVHNFSSAINSKFGEVFFGKIVVKKEENPNPTMSATVRLFELGADGKFKPLDAVLLVYFENTTQIAEALGSGTSIYAGIPEQQGRLTREALLESYRTSDIYLVNSDRVMVTHSRITDSQQLYTQVNTTPVRECFENGKEISDEYDNYQGTRVLGSSMCFKNEGVMVIVEVNKDEVYAPLIALARTTVFGGSAATVLGIIIIILFIRQPLTRISDVVSVAEQVAKGDLNTQVKVTSKDELGYLSTSFNAMIASIRNTQKELRASKHKVEEEKAKDEALLASLGEGMIATDNSGKIIAINRMAEKMLDLDSADVVGKNVIDVIEILDEEGKEISPEQHSIALTTMKATTTINTMRYRHKNDGYFPVAATITPVVLAGKVVGSINIFRDITKEKELEEARKDLLSLASHQLRTPLSGTKWLIETLKKGLHGPLTAGQTEYLNEIYRINERMTSLVHDMLNILRIEGGGTLAKKEQTSTNIILSMLFETFHGVAESKKISLDIIKDGDYTIETDSFFLQNILEVIVSNAINYSEPNKKVIVNVEQKQTEVIFTVKDSGIGIPRAEQPQIYDRFYRASNAKTFDTRGSGLGLYTAAILAKKIGVTFSFESDVNQGTTFHVHVPLKPQTKAA